jgi:hypothetical protein
MLEYVSWREARGSVRLKDVHRICCALVQGLRILSAREL